MTTGVTTVLDDVEDVFKKIVWDSVVEGGLEVLFTAVPWLRIWPISTLVRFVVNQFTDLMFGALKLMVDLQAIVFINAAHRKAYDTELVKLKILAANDGKDSPEFLKERENAKQALAVFVHFIGT